MFSEKKIMLICTGSYYIFNIFVSSPKSQSYIHQLLIQTSIEYNRNLPIRSFLIGRNPFKCSTIFCLNDKKAKAFPINIHIIQYKIIVIRRPKIYSTIGSCYFNERSLDINRF